jgi:hypothetical protein
MSLLGQTGAIELASIISLMLLDADLRWSVTQCRRMSWMCSNRRSRFSLRLFFPGAARRPVPTSGCTVPRDIFQGSPLAQIRAARDIELATTDFVVLARRDSVS